MHLNAGEDRQAGRSECPHKVLSRITWGSHRIGSVAVYR
jgi:hypothetical protein